MYKVKETNDTPETKKEPRSREGKISIRMALFITQPATVQPSALARPMHRKRANPKIGQLGEPAPIESTPIASQRVEDLFHVQTRSGSIRSLSRNRPCHTIYSPHVRSTGVCERGVLHHTSHPLGDGPAEGPPKIKKHPIGFPHAVPSLEGTRDPFSFRSEP